MAEEWTTEIPEFLRSLPRDRRIKGGAGVYGRTFGSVELTVQTLPDSPPPLFHWAVEFSTEQYPCLPTHRGVMTFRTPGRVLSGEIQPSVVRDRSGGGWRVALHGVGPLRDVTSGCEVFGG